MNLCVMLLYILKLIRKCAKINLLDMLQITSDQIKVKELNAVVYVDTNKMKYF